MASEYLERSNGNTDYLLWTPDKGRTVKIGADRHPFSLPEIPLPIHRADLTEGEPTDEAVGRGLYDYLRQYPDCHFNRQYAELLRDAFSHFLADLGAQIAMLDHKEVDSPYVQRKLTYLKIFSLLEPENPRILQMLGKTCFELAFMFPELKHSRFHLLKAMGYLQQSLKILPEDPASLNYLGEIDYYLGDYSAAARRWTAVADLVGEAPVRNALLGKVKRVQIGEVTDHPLIDDLEATGEAMELLAAGKHLEALAIMERLEEEGTIVTEFPSAQFFCLLGECREKTSDPAGAFAAFENALEIDSDFGPAREGKERILDGRSS
jgi:tetratricopeptide (TPR) repeat protein